MITFLLVICVNQAKVKEERSDDAFKFMTTVKVQQLILWLLFSGQWFDAPDAKC